MLLLDVCFVRVDPDNRHVIGREAHLDQSHVMRCFNAS